MLIRWKEAAPASVATRSLATKEKSEGVAEVEPYRERYEDSEQQRIYKRRRVHNAK